MSFDVSARSLAIYSVGWFARKTNRVRIELRAALFILRRATDTLHVKASENNCQPLASGFPTLDAINITRYIINQTNIFNVNRSRVLKVFDRQQKPADF
jgi:hypothetical protein